MSNELIERLCLDIDPDLSNPTEYYEKERLEAAECIYELMTEIEDLRNPKYNRMGKQILFKNSHFADCASEDIAELILEKINQS
tara:strand:- start:306 stop:557 length:252 start_codon:yes stop_codon:yes gene_type:complete